MRLATTQQKNGTLPNFCSFSTTNPAHGFFFPSILRCTDFTFSRYAFSTSDGSTASCARYLTYSASAFLMACGWPVPLGANLSEFPTGCLLAQFTFSIDIGNVLNDISARGLKQVSQLLLTYRCRKSFHEMLQICIQIYVPQELPADKVPVQINFTEKPLRIMSSIVCIMLVSG